MEKTQKNSNQILNQTKQNQPQQEEQLLDFSAMFKKNATITKPKLGQKTLKPQGPNWLLQIPAKLEITKQHLSQRKVLDMKRWMNMVKGSKQQYLVSSVISIWNYFYSDSGLGKQNFLTLQQLKTFCNLAEFNSQGRSTQQKVKLVTQLLHIICSKFQTPILKHQIINLNQGQNCQKELDSILKGLKQNKGYIYFAYGKILCPIGYEITPMVPLDAYKKLQDIEKQKQQLWIIMSQCGSQQRSFMIKRWKDIELELKSQWPQYLDLDQAKKGRQRSSQQSQESSLSKRQKSFMIQLYY